MEHLVDLDSLAFRLRPDLQRWKQRASLAPLTWRDEKAHWPQPIVDDRSRVQVPESLGIQLQRGSDQLQFVSWTGGWADVYSYVGGVPSVHMPAFTDVEGAYAEITSSIDAFLDGRDTSTAR